MAKVSKKVVSKRKPVSTKTAGTTGARKKVSKTGAKVNATKPSGISKSSSTSYRVKTGDKAPLFKAMGTSGKTLESVSLKGRPIVLYFYPKDNTPGCTLEGQDFKRLYSKFKAAGAEVIGVSRDSVRSHEGFKDKCGFPFELLADETGEVCKAFDVIQMKSLYGRKFEGIERSTFVIAADGRIAAEWRKVKVGGHADEVLGVVANLKD